MVDSNSLTETVIFALNVQPYTPDVIDAEPVNVVFSASDN